MVDDKMRKSLTKLEGKKGTFTYYIIICAPLFFIVMGLLNLHTASTIGSWEKYDLVQLFQNWLAQINVKKQYSGIFLLAMQRFEIALDLFGFAIIATVYAFVVRAERERNRKIISLLKRHGEWPDEAK